MERVPTAISGLDELINGGIPKGASVLVSGGTGTGKTIFASQFIYNGALDYAEPGLFVSFESSLRNVVWNMESFGWDVKKMGEKNLMKLYRLKIDPAKDVQKQMDSELDMIASMVDENNITRLAVDSISVFGVWIKELGDLRNLLFNFSEKLKELNVTTMLTAETKGGPTDFSSFGVEEFVVDGVIALYFTPPHRSIFVRKMRGTDHSKTVHPFEITQQGITVKPKDEVMWQAIR